mmetsp:Transcript_798/g.2196  ORF Transcript_798/g.2196 Transcript_798/m.2196 type:complete len:506 (+) Transcript_798:88-1605(+)
MRSASVLFVVAMTFPVALVLVGMQLGWMGWMPAVRNSILGLTAAQSVTRPELEPPGDLGLTDAHPLAAVVLEARPGSAPRVVVVVADARGTLDSNSTAAIAAPRHASDAQAGAGGTRTPSPALRVHLLHWNILEGGAGRLPLGWGGVPRDTPRAIRLEGIKAFTRRGAYDVATFNELNGFHPDSLAALGAELGMPHTRLLSKSEFRLGVISRVPFEVVTERREAPFAHGMLCVRLREFSLTNDASLTNEAPLVNEASVVDDSLTNKASVVDASLVKASLDGPRETRASSSASSSEGKRDMHALQVCLTHLDPHSSLTRVLEAEQIAAHIRAHPLISTVLLGDLNTLSPLDVRQHTANRLAQKIGNGPRAKQLARKFLDTARRKIDYSPMQVLLDAPLLDLGALTKAGAHTAPTRVNADHMHFKQLRLDYALVSDSLRSACRSREQFARSSSTPPAEGAPNGHGGAELDTLLCSARVVVSEETEQLSDHFPLDVWLAVPPLPLEAS